MQKAGSVGKKLGIGLFLFFFIKGLVWLAVIGAAAFGITSL